MFLLCVAFARVYFTMFGWVSLLVHFINIVSYDVVGASSAKTEQVPPELCMDETWIFC